MSAVSRGNAYDGIRIYVLQACMRTFINEVSVPIILIGTVHELKICICSVIYEKCMYCIRAYKKTRIDQDILAGKVTRVSHKPCKYI
jgi:hypothetical protein